MRVPALLVAMLAVLSVVPASMGARHVTTQDGVLPISSKLEVSGATSSRRFGADCLPGTPQTVECFDVKGSGIIPGLGKVAMTQLQLIDTAPEGCPTERFRVLGSSIRLVVSGKGELQLSTGAADGCRPLSEVTSHARSFTIDRGTGRYAGASGSGTVRRAASFSGGGVVGTETYVGRLEVSGLKFDLTPPKIALRAPKAVVVAPGAVTARVTYSVGARDAVDGVVAVRCAPPSGARFPIGRTKVRCSATDSSGNTRTMSFTATVRRR